MIAVLYRQSLKAVSTLHQYVSSTAASCPRAPMSSPPLKQLYSPSLEQVHVVELVEFHGELHRGLDLTHLVLLQRDALTSSDTPAREHTHTQN